MTDSVKSQVETSKTMSMLHGSQEELHRNMEGISQDYPESPL